MHNVYASGEAPLSPTFSQWAAECTEALEDAYLNAVPKSKVRCLQFRLPNTNTILVKVGAIYWPLRLSSGAADRGYTDDTIQTALYHMFSSIFDIICGHQPHPIMDLFSSFMMQQQIQFNNAHPNHKPKTRDLQKMELELGFSVPILRGDASLAEEFIVNLQCQIMQSSGKCVNLRITQLLFHLVILRTYLS